MTGIVDVARLPINTLEAAADCYIVVDVLRATTTIATLFAAGMESLLVAGEIDFARERAAAEGRLLFGEVHGLRRRSFSSVTTIRC